MDRAGQNQRSAFEQVYLLFYLLSDENDSTVGPIVVGEVFLACAQGVLKTRIIEKENYDDRDWRKKNGENGEKG